MMLQLKEDVIASINYYLYSNITNFNANYS